MSEAGELFKSGDLTGALSAAFEAVREKPTDIARRGFLCELLCFDGQWKRADQQLETIGKQDSTTLVGAGALRQLIRAELARSEFHRQGRVPEIVVELSETCRLLLDASVAAREGNAASAAETIARAEATRHHSTGTCNGSGFSDWRDLDDLCAAYFEVLTASGKYYWVPFEAVRSVEFRPPTDTRDLIWRSVHLVFAGGTEGEVYIPVLYWGSSDADHDRIKLGQMTDWIGGDGEPVRGIGQRMFLVGDTDMSILELERVEFAPSESA